LAITDRKEMTGRETRRCRQTAGIHAADMLANDETCCETSKQIGINEARMLASDEMKTDKLRDNQLV
jgi:hypothetical protein